MTLERPRVGAGHSCPHRRTGTLGAYTTLASEYCAVISATNTGTAAGQVVGWLDGGLEKLTS